MVRGLAFVLLAGCGHIDFAALGDGGGGGGGGGGSSDGAAACTVFGAWSTPQPVTAINTVANDWEPELSPDGQWLVFSSVRLDPHEHLFIAQVSGGVVGTPREVTELATSQDESGPAWDGTGANLYYNSDVSGSYLLYEASFSGGTFGAGVEVASLASSSVISPSISADDLEIVSGTSSSNATSDVTELVRATSSDAWPAAGTSVEPLGNGWPSLSGDRMTLYYEGTGMHSQIFMAARQAITGPFDLTTVFELDDVDVDEGDPFISHDGLTYLFASSRPGGAGLNDVWISTRTCAD